MAQPYKAIKNKHISASAHYDDKEMFVFSTKNEYRVSCFSVAKDMIVIGMYAYETILAMKLKFIFLLLWGFIGPNGCTVHSIMRMYQLNSGIYVTLTLNTFPKAHVNRQVEVYEYQ